MVVGNGLDVEIRNGTQETIKWSDTSTKTINALLKRTKRRETQHYLNRIIKEGFSLSASPKSMDLEG